MLPVSVISLAFAYQHMAMGWHTNLRGVKFLIQYSDLFIPHVDYFCC